MARYKQAALALLLFGTVLVTMLLPYRNPDRVRHFDRFLEIGDFNAFYCGGFVARSGADPYQFAPLAACQARLVDAPGGVPFARRGIDPAPLPMYDLALFEPLSLLGFRLAGMLWSAMLLGAVVASAEALRRLCKIPFWVAFAFLSTIDGISCIEFAQEQPFVTLALTCAANLLRAGRTNSAACVASLSLIEPHVGLPVVCAVFVWTRGRLAVAACVAIFAAVALAFGGPAVNAEYFAKVLPVHALSEISQPIQYSFTTFLSAFGVSDRVALTIASAQYLLMISVAVALAGPIARRIGAPAIVLFPASCAVLGGTFVHIFQISSAVPFALYLAACVPELASAGWIAALLLALPWPAYGFYRGYLILDLALIAAALLSLSSLRETRARFVLVLAATFACYLVSGVAMKHLPSTTYQVRESPSVVARDGFDFALASTVLAYDERKNRTGGASVFNLATRLPTWIALLITFGAAATCAVKSFRPAEQRIATV